VAAGAIFLRMFTLPAKYDALPAQVRMAASW
jgi:hypothetical protein